MKNIFRLAMLALVAAFGVGSAQNLEASAGSPFGVNAGLRFDLGTGASARIYVGGVTTLGAGADFLLNLPGSSATYIGVGGFISENSVLSAVSTGNKGARAVIGSRLDLGLIDYVNPFDLYFELHPMVFFPDGMDRTYGIGGSFGAVFKFSF